MQKLWEPVELGRLTLPNRLAMAPMTRSRATREGVPTEMNARYYMQRASMGLIISEASQPSDQGQGYIFTPGIYTPEQVAGWRRVTDAVHAAGGRIYIQIMHVGRIAHPANTLQGKQPVAPSAVTPNSQMYTLEGMLPVPQPRELTTQEIKSTVDDFRRAAACAIEAGADGVEIHGANGYLIHQFLGDTTNLRTDEYGGSTENRIRFAVEVARAIASEIGADRTGMRISPGNPFNDMVENNAAEVYGALVPELAKLRLAYLHVLNAGKDELVRSFRAQWPTVLMVNRPGRPLETISIDVDSGTADVVSVGSFALANPDLVERLKAGAALNEPDQASFYGGGEAGYTDYPSLQHATAK